MKNKNSEKTFNKKTNNKNNETQNKTKDEKNIKNIDISSNTNIINKKTKREKGKINKADNSKDDTVSLKYLKDFIDAQDLYPFCNYIIFKSIINGIYYLIYATEKLSFICYDLIDNKKINEIKKCHKKNIYHLRHICDNENKRDIMLSLSYNNNIKVWDIFNIKCIVELKNINAGGDEFIFSACFLKNNHEIYIVTSNCEHHDSIKTFNLKGQKTKEIENNNGQTRFIDSYYDNKLSKNFIIAEGMFALISYDYNTQKQYQIYDKPKFKHTLFYNIMIYEDEEKTKLIGAFTEIKIWDFHSGKILQNIKFETLSLLDKLCLWNNQYLFVISKPHGENFDYAGKEDNTIKLIDLKNGKIIKYIIRFKNFYLFYITKLIHPYFGECLLTFGYDYIFKLWIAK